MAIEHMGGAVSRVGSDETAFPHRDRPYNFLCLGMSADPAEAEPTCAGRAGSGRRCSPSPAAVYVNYLGAEVDEGAERVRAAYGAAKYERDWPPSRRHMIRPISSG